MPADVPGRGTGFDDGLPPLVEVGAMPAAENARRVYGLSAADGPKGDG